ncbi:hypothetical protein KZP23_04820 [Echinicola marina]|uniref:HNH endonuclease n=1 Tax=Echinicola marina TaxID=2859768 RepID=UPI001CF71824|nr:hypothetical protein [Echinicola marina]UCS94356.1 hypothetical protein KZP23_04820 [Echinicola marina]
MKQKRKSYYNPDWHKFAKTVRIRDGNKCLKCHRQEPIVSLQVHHKIYKPGLKPWEYPLSDCITLCKGCHAREHGIVEPDSGWILVSIEDLGDLIGTCERKGCGNDIRYEHVTYHPKCGYRSVGSTCVEHLTREDQFKSKEVIKLFNKISDFLSKAFWERRLTRKEKGYICTTHAHHQIRIYGKRNYYSFQIVLKRKGEKWFDFQNIINTRNTNLERVKELGYIALKGLISSDKEEKDLLREVYRRIK